MSERRFDIVFSGKLASGADPQQVKQNVAALFNLDDETLSTLFSGDRVTIKKGVDRATAVKYQQAMTKAGAVIQLVLHQAAETTVKGTPAQAVSPTDKHETPTARDAEASPDTTAALSVLPPGSDLLTHSERKHVPSANIDTSHLQTEDATSNPFIRDDTATSPVSRLEPQPSYPTPMVDASTGDLELGELGAGENPNPQTAEPLDIDTSHLSAPPADGELLTIEERSRLNSDAPAIELNLELTVSEAGEDLLSESEKAEQVVADIDTSQLSIEDSANSQAT